MVSERPFAALDKTSFSDQEISHDFTILFSVRGQELGVFLDKGGLLLDIVISAYKSGKYYNVQTTDNDWPEGKAH